MKKKSPPFSRLFKVGVVALAAFKAESFTPSNVVSHDNGLLQQRRLSTRVIDELPIVTTDTMPPPISDIHMINLQETRKFTPFQLFTRISTFAGVVGYMINPQPFDHATASAWSVIYNWEPAHQPLFEAAVASTGFFVSIAFFSILHLILGEEKVKEARFDGKMPVDPLSWAKPENFHLWFNPLASYMGSIWFYQQFHERAPMPEVAPTFGVFGVELFFGVFLYDLCFFPIHYLMHHSKWGEMRKVHGYHHRWSTHSLNSLETVQHSYIDGFLQVVVNILVQQISPFGGPKHTMSRLMHNIVVTYLLSEAHSGYNMPWMSHNIFPEFLGGSPRHEKHHHDGRVYYQQYFKYLDDFFGFTEEERKKKKIKTTETVNTEFVLAEAKALEVIGTKAF